MKINSFKMKLSCEKEYWSVLITIRENYKDGKTDERTDWTDKYLLVKNYDNEILQIRSTKSKEYFESRAQDVYPEITYEQFIKLYGAKPSD
jgi:hypothetical protein